MEITQVLFFMAPVMEDLFHNYQGGGSGQFVLRVDIPMTHCIGAKYFSIGIQKVS